jgi:putative MATE family efflux protein
MKTKSKLPDHTNSPIIKSIITLALPIIFGNILQTAYQLVDTFWVGRLGANAVAAVSISFPIIFLIISIAGGLAISGTILVSQYKGQGNTAKVDFVSAQTILMMLITGTISSIIGYMISPFIIKLMGASPEVFVDAVNYIRVSFVGLLFMFGFSVYQSLLRGVGNVKTPLYVVFGAVILNSLLDPVFIMGFGPIPAMGVKGAAIATLITQAIATIIGFFMLINGKHGIHLKASNLKADIKLVKKMFNLGLPASISQSARAIGMLLMTFLVASFGTVTVASYGIGGRMLSFVIIPAYGLSMAVSTLVGQNIGAGKMDRAIKITKIGAIVSFVSLSFVGILTFIFSTQLVTFFIPDDLEVIESGAYFLKIVSLTFGCIGLQQIYNGTFQGSGNTGITMILSLVSLFVIQFPLAYILSKHTFLVENGIYWAFPVTNISTALITYIWFRKGTWKKKKIIEEVEKGEIMMEAEIEEGF